MKMTPSHKIIFYWLPVLAIVGLIYYHYHGELIKTERIRLYKMSLDGYITGHSADRGESLITLNDSIRIRFWAFEISDNRTAFSTRLLVRGNHLFKHADSDTIKMTTNEKKIYYFLFRR